jgi:hypothetical protein
VARFLTQAWVDQVNGAAAGASPPPDVAFAVAHHVTGGPEGDVVYVLRIAGGTVTAALGSNDGIDIHLHEDYATACAIARGDMSAQQAVASGRLRLSGDTRALVRHAEAFNVAAAVLRPVATDTTY